MLKISKSEKNGGSSVELKIEGKIIGEWAHTLQQTCCQILEGGSQQLILDFSSVTSIDREGLRLLKKVDCSRIKIVGLSLFLKDRLCGTRLKHCVIDSESEQR